MNTLPKSNTIKSKSSSFPSPSGRGVKGEGQENTASSATDPEHDVIEGRVIRITFTNAETGFSVLRVKPHRPTQWTLATTRIHQLEDSEGLVTVVGTFMNVAIGETIRAVGTIIQDARYGSQLRAEVITVQLPTTLSGIEKYLGSGVIKGVGPSTAQKIVSKFGERALYVLDHESHRLSEIRGLGKERSQRIATAWREQRVARELMVAFASLGISVSVAHRIAKRYGDQALEIVHKQPYRLAIDVWGVGFKSADAIARQVGLALDDPHRIQAGVLHALHTLAEEGHTVTPREQLQDKSIRLLTGLNAADPNYDSSWERLTEQAIDTLVVSGLITKQPEGYAHTPLSDHETGVARELARLMKGTQRSLVSTEKLEQFIEHYERHAKIKLAEAQRTAIGCCVENSVLVITGGPGVGKTTILRAILSLFESVGLQTKLAAPTGRAAKRMTESTSREALTLHRLLEVDPRSVSFLRNEHRPIEAQALIVDEASMIDVVLMHALLRALPKRTRLVLVGDVDQLPSIGPGAVLRDWIQSDVVPTTRLTHVFRQSSASYIVAGAHAILRGEEPKASPKPQQARSMPQGELFKIERNTPEETAQTIVDVVANRIPNAFGLNPMHDVQVLVPMVRGPMGTHALNFNLQSCLNAKGPEIYRGPRIFRVNDRVMQTRNDYEREVFNGDIGHVVWVRSTESNDDDRALVVRLDEGREVAYTDEQLDELTLAYACTIHKSQGSEYPAVVLGLVNSHYIMLARKLVYTAVTRAKRLVVIVGSAWALREAIANHRAEERRTTLARKLRELS